MLPGDILVLDNAAIHTGKECDALDEWLWEYHGIFVLLLPARTPEWNPIELIWQILVRRLGLYSLSEVARQIAGVDSVAYAAHDVLGSITREEVVQSYNHCYKGI